MENKILESMDGSNLEFVSALGNDLVFLPGFTKSFTADFKRKVYTESEIAYCESFSDPLLRFASTWAAKEAVCKALKQVSSTPISWKKIEIIREKAAGRPHVTLHTEISPKFCLTISHDGDYVWAIAWIKTA